MEGYFVGSYGIAVSSERGTPVQSGVEGFLYIPFQRNRERERKKPGTKPGTAPSGVEGYFGDDSALLPEDDVAFLCKVLSTRSRVLNRVLNLGTQK